MCNDIRATTHLTIGGRNGVLAGRWNTICLPKPGQQANERTLLLRRWRRAANQRDMNCGIATREARHERRWAAAAPSIDRARAVDDEVKRQILPAEHLREVGQQLTDKRRRAHQIVRADLVQNDTSWRLEHDRPIGRRCAPTLALNNQRWWRQRRRAIWRRHKLLLADARR